jgi:hypothetical protein
VDVNGDGNIDILSGSYSRPDQDMAGLFQVLYGSKDRTFKGAAALDGSDEKPLILPAGRGQDDVIDKICTRPFACDLDGDGKLDLVVGNFRGTFGFFRGEGGGKFAPKATWLEANGGAMAVDGHGDPFLVDWDGDKDLDLLSGSANGGVFLFANVGSKTAPKFGARQTLVEPAGHRGGESRFGDAHCVAPASDTRVWAADVDGNGKLDLLVGDTITLYFKADGVDEATARTKDADWQKRQQAHMGAYPQDGDEAAQRKWQEDYQKLDKEREAFVREDMTGFVWLLRQK